MDINETLNEEMMEKPVLDLKKEKKWCSGIGFSYFLFVILAIGGQIGMMYLIAYIFPQVMYNISVYYVFVMMPIYVLAFPIVATILKKTKEKQDIEKHSMKVGHFIISIGMCFTLMIVGNIMGMIVNFVIGFIKGAPVGNSITQMIGGMDTWASMLLVVICAPIVEEIVFRKLLVDRIVKYGEGIAIVTSGLMFGLFHGNFSQFFYATFLGMFFAFIYSKTGKIWYTILLHMIVNFSSGVVAPLLLSFMGTDLLETMQDTSKLMEFIESGEVVTILVPLLLYLLYVVFLYGLAIMGGVFFALKHKSFTFRTGIVELPKGKKVSVVWGNVGMILFILANLALFAMALA